MTGDRVVAQDHAAVKDDDDRLTGEIVRVLDRAHTSVVGTLRQETDGWLVQPDGGDFFRPIEIEVVDTRERSAMATRSRSSIRLYPTRSQPARGVITEVLGRPGRFETEIVRRHPPPSICTTPSIRAAWSRPATPRWRSIRTTRAIARTLPATLIVTIDPPDAKDFDDAVSLTRDEQGQLGPRRPHRGCEPFRPGRLGAGSSRPPTGQQRLSARPVLPMLPEMLSNGICSLQPGQRRYTKSVFLTYNKDGQVLVRPVRQHDDQVQGPPELPAGRPGTEGRLRAVFSEDVVALLHDMDDPGPPASRPAAAGRACCNCRCLRANS